MDEHWGTEPRIEAGKLRLREVLTPRKTTMTYVYDFSDDRTHRVILMNIRQGGPGISFFCYSIGLIRSNGLYFRRCKDCRSRSVGAVFEYEDDPDCDSQARAERDGLRSRCLAPQTAAQQRHHG